MGLFSFLTNAFTKSVPLSIHEEPQNVFSITKIETMSDAQKLILREQYQSLKKHLEDTSRIENSNREKQVREKNSTCPKCMSNNVINCIKQLKGEMNGDFYGSGTSSLFGSYYNSTGSIAGKIDTYPVNKCNGCENEWEIIKVVRYSKTLEEIASDVCGFYISVDKVYQTTFNPHDLNENYSSLEEKRNSLITNLKTSWYGKSVIEFFSDYSIELIQYVIKTEIIDNPMFKSWRYAEWENGDKSLLTTVLEIPSIIK